MSSLQSSCDPDPWPSFLDSVAQTQVPLLYCIRGALQRVATADPVEQQGEVLSTVSESLAGGLLLTVRSKHDRQATSPHPMTAQV
jgi:hypothetical protein